MELFPKDQRAGVFRGFSNGGMEFHADIVLPYKEKLHNIPMHGQFLLVQLENPQEAVLGRICSLSADGKLTSHAGEQYSIRAVEDERVIPDHLRENYLKYRVDIRVLGVVRIDNNNFIFAPSHRRLPHVGSPVSFLSDEVLEHICGAKKDGADIGHFALGEYVYCGNDARASLEPWHQKMDPNITVKFDIHNLVSRRTLVFARAGYGKSNLNKLLFKNLYSKTPTTNKRGGKEVPVGTVIFDPDGEYFWPDDQGRPGLCDVPDLQNQIVVFTSREAPSNFYASFSIGKVKLDIRELNPSDVISIALSPEKQDQQNVRKLRGLSPRNWSQLVDIIHEHKNSADPDIIRSLMNLETGQDAELFAARSNMSAIVSMLHDPSSQLMAKLLECLSDGKLCIVDISQMRGGPSLILAGLVLRRIFQHNQMEFTKADSKAIPTIAVIEEAQSVLGSHNSSSEPFVEWVKEGRKYGLGAFLVTQQPGSIGSDILSQGDNWFMFHLLSETDLRTAKSANAHFSNDLLSTLLNEPIRGQGVFWSSTGNTIYPIPLRVMSFESEVDTIDKDYNLNAIDCYASEIRVKYDNQMHDLQDSVGDESSTLTDNRRLLVLACAKHLREHRSIIQEIGKKGKIKRGRLYYLAKEVSDKHPSLSNQSSDIAGEAVNVFIQNLQVEAVPFREGEESGSQFIFFE